MSGTGTPRGRMGWLATRALIFALSLIVFLEGCAAVLWLLRPVYASAFMPGSAGATFLDWTSSGLYLLRGVAYASVVIMLLAGAIGFLRILLGPVGPHLSSASGRLKQVKEALGVDEVFSTLRRRGGAPWLPDALLLLSLVSAIVIAAYPYLPGFSLSRGFVGVDVPYYALWLQGMNSAGSAVGTLSNAFHLAYDRGLSLILMFAWWKLSGLSAMQTAQYFPLVLAPALVCVTYLFARLAGVGPLASSFFSLFTAFSFQVTVGMAGGFLANWTGLLFFCLFFGSLLLSLRAGSRRALLLTAPLQVAILLTHSYTWAVALGVTGLLLVIYLLGWLRRVKVGREVAMLASILGLGVAAYLIRNEALSVPAVGSEVLSFAGGALASSNLLSFVPTLMESVGESRDFVFLNPALLSLAAVGAVAAASDDRLLSRFLTAFLAGASPLFFFGDVVMQTRILYVLPVQVLAVLGLFTLQRVVARRINGRHSALVGCLLVAAFALISLNFALGSSYNLTTLGPLF
ncbi:MAG: hypothetical protein ABSG92_06665 [Conexivisphaerales archaeon]